MVALLLIKATFIAATKAIKEVVWIVYFPKLLKILYNIYFLVQLYCNNQGAISLSNNSKNYKRTKYIDIYYYYI